MTTPAAAASRRQRRAPSTRARGFTLIEMIAAFVIFAIAVGSLMQILSMSMNNARRSVDETRAALWAQSLLDVVGIGERIEAGSSSGEFDDRYRWQLEIEPVDPEAFVASGNEAMLQAAHGGVAGVGNSSGGASPIMDIAQMELYHVTLVVTWGDPRARGHQATFTTMRAVMPDPSQGMTLGGGSRGGAGMPAPSRGAARAPASATTRSGGRSP
ncbi:type IV pilus modification PilV family protein [Dokdonella sp. MW10]|uniref:type IV pilus modification PilV family protein n=1 Tax=Dokdonella sp. MW10 TaxID=2992926 RepID=UPI003F81A34E